LSLTGLVFLIAFFAGCLLAVVRHPIYGLMTYVAVFYLHPPSRWWGESLPDLRWSLSAAAVTLLGMIILRKRLAPRPALFSNGVMVGMALFVAWLGLQLLWALDEDLQNELFSMYFKYALVMVLIYKCVDSERHLRLFLWTHVLGCAYLGWLAFTSYAGGRFEGFGGPGLGEANVGALQVVTGLLVAGSLLLAGKMRERMGLLACIPFLLNAMVATVSRSGFLAAGIGGVLFNLFTPKRWRGWVRVLSVLALVLFMLLTNPEYWMRIGSLKHAGEDISGVDTGSGRLVIIDAQWQMFQRYPLGCGHRCTAVLSTDYLDDSQLTGEATRGRSSHNTFMTLLVEQGVPGALIYLAMLVWLLVSVRKLSKRYRGAAGDLPLLFPAVVGVLGAITLGDMFVDYLKSEVRIWFIGVLMVLLTLPVSAPETAAQAEPAKPKSRQRASAFQRGAREP
jgi:hypothetical protein